MDELEKENIRRWVAGWQKASIVLERMRTEAIRNSDTAAAIEQLSDAFESSLLHYQPPATSGLVEQQQIFARLRL